MLKPNESDKHPRRQRGRRSGTLDDETPAAASETVRRQAMPAARRMLSVVFPWPAGFQPGGPNR